MRLVLSLLLLVICSCAVNASDQHPQGFETHPFSASAKPVTVDGVTTFQIFDRQCSDADFGDGRGESDCLNGTVRSTFRNTEWARVGETKSYQFDLWIDPEISYQGWRNPNAVGFLRGGNDSRLRLAYWEGELLHNFIYHLKASKRTGLTFEGAVCQEPRAFGNWVSFTMDVRWADDDRGWIRVRCDDRTIYLKEGIATVQAPQCFGGNVCEPGVAKHPKKINFVFGANMWGNGMEWESFGHPSQFTEIQPEGITIKARNVAVTEDPVLYGEAEAAQVKELQTRLTNLGCDPGAADGIAGKKTRMAALECRRFPNGQMPTEFTVETVGKLVELYSRPDAAGLPPGGSAGLPEATMPAAIKSIESFRREKDVRVETRFQGTTADGVKLDFTLSGTYSYPNANFVTLNLAFPVSAKIAENVSGCGGRTVEIDDATHAIFKLKRDGSSFSLLNLDCVADAAPKSADQLRYLAEHFRDLALSINKSRQIEDIGHEGVEEFMSNVAAGEITVAAEAS